MRERRGRDDELCSGPGKLTEALGVGLDLNGAPIDAPPFEIREPIGPTRRAGPRRPAHRDHQGRRAALALLRGGKPLRVGRAEAGA